MAIVKIRPKIFADRSNTFGMGVYTNDLPNIVNNVSVYIYADHTSLRFRTDNMSRLNEALNALNKDLEA